MAFLIKPMFRLVPLYSLLQGQCYRHNTTRRLFSCLILCFCESTTCSNQYACSVLKKLVISPFFVVTNLFGYMFDMTIFCNKQLGSFTVMLEHLDHSNPNALSKISTIRLLRLRHYLSIFGADDWGYFNWIRSQFYGGHFWESDF